MAGILMNIKKTITIIILAATLLVIAILILINISFFKEIPTVGPEPKEMLPAEVGEPGEAVPSNAIPAGQMIKDIINRNIEKQKTLQERELEAERIRNANRAEAFARQKELETSLTHAPQKAAAPALLKKEPSLLSEEEMKAMEKKGIISY
jgi:hypothetical protein